MRVNLCHLNGNLLCGMDIETTGLSFEKHEIYELAIIPMNDKLYRDKSKKWLDLKIKPTRPENIDWEGAHKIKNPNKVKDALQNGLESNTAMEILELWFEKLNLGTKKIAPVGQNCAFESRFLRMWLGDFNYDAKFNDGEMRDTLNIARFLNDVADFRGEDKFPYGRCELNYLANALKVEHDYGYYHTALADAATTVDIYRRMIEELNKVMIP